MERSTSPVADSSGRKVRLLKSRWNGRFSITVTLATAISLLVLISVGTVLGVGIWLAQKNTLTLLSENATQNVAVIVQRISQHLKPAEYQAQFIATRISSGDIDPNDRKIIGLTLTGALAATPQVDAVMFIRPSLQADFAGRTGPSGKVSFQTIDYSDDPIVRERTREAYLAARQSRDLGARWIAPVWREQPKKTYMIVGYPVWRDDEWIGSVVAIVSVRELSEFLSKTTSADSGRRFVLYGRNHVLAHP
ncbi:MAG: cache domain-containing protein, partial [Rhodospirillaceae bacterium]|nr:cache domain-containing protein [Rhodospirillaceae bacterium]